MAFNRKIYVVGGAKDYASWMEPEEFVSSISAAELVVFTGGEDINPAIYQEKRHPKTYFNQRRDDMEVQCFLQAKELKKKMVGICRGAQLLGAMSGGRLVQHQANLDTIHLMETDSLFLSDRWIPITSSHHQAQYPWEMAVSDFKVIAWTRDQSPFHLDGEGNEMIIDNGEPWEGKEVEICHYPTTKCLGIQGHPEWMFPKRLTDKESMETIVYLRRLLDKFFWGSL